MLRSFVVEGNLRGERHPRRKSEVVDLATTARIRYRTSCKLRREKEGKPVTEHRKQPSNLIIALVRRQILLSLVELVTVNILGFCLCTCFSFRWVL